MNPGPNKGKKPWQNINLLPFFIFKKLHKFVTHLWGKYIEFPLRNSWVRAVTDKTVRQAALRRAESWCVYPCNSNTFYMKLIPDHTNIETKNTMY